MPSIKKPFSGENAVADAQAADRRSPAADVMTPFTRLSRASAARSWWSRGPAMAAAGTLLAAAIAVVMVIVVHPGQPYDEPSHWATVEFYRTHLRLPVLGEPGTTYEAQMGPVYYTLAAVVSAIGHVGGNTAAFYAVRIAGLALLPLLAWLTYAIARECSLSSGWAGVAAALTVMNPLVLAMASSVQNDCLAIVATMAVVLLALRTLRGDAPRFASSFLVGAIAGVAILVKVNAAAVVPGVLILVWAREATARRPARSALTSMVGVMVGVGVVSGWWFARNLALYGDLTGSAGVDRVGASFAPATFRGFVERLTSAPSYTYMPVEYLRNDIVTPAALKILIIVVFSAVAVVALVGGWRLIRQRRALALAPDWLFVGSVAAAGIAGWAAFSVITWLAPVRLVWASFPVIVLAVVALWAHAGRWGRWAVAACLGLSAAGAVTYTVLAAGIPHRPFWLT